MSDLHESDIIMDTREKHPLFKGGTKKKLDVGDYTIKGLEDILRVERKNGINELTACLCTSSRFWKNTFPALLNFKMPYLLIECEFHDFLHGTTYSRMPPEVRLRRLNLMIVAGLPVLFFGERTNRMEDASFDFFESIWFLWESGKLSFDKP